MTDTRPPSEIFGVLQSARTAQPGHVRMKEEEAHMAQATESRRMEGHAFIRGFHGIRYQVKDVARAVAFYTQHLGFTVGHQQLPAFALVSIGDGHILLS